MILDKERKISDRQMQTYDSLSGDVHILTHPKSWHAVVLERLKVLLY